MSDREMVVSADGTTIACTREGRGPALVLVGGAADDGQENAPIAPAMADRFTVWNYARRGRGSSGDTQPYDVAREIEDLTAVITAAGGPAHMFGASSGGALALEAAAAGAPIDHLVVYEVPYDTSPGAAQRHRDYTTQIDALLAQDRRGDAFALAMSTWGAPPEAVEDARHSPVWAHLEQLAPTLAYDARCMGDNLPPPERLARITQPTLVMTGSSHPKPTKRGPGADPAGFFDSAADAIAGAVPRAQREVLWEQGHVVDPMALKPALEQFLLS